MVKIAARMRAEMQKRSGPFHQQEIAAALDLVFDVDKEPMYRAMRDFVRRGEVERLSTGVYRYIGTTSKTFSAEARERIWKAIRAARAFTLDELVRVSGAGKTYCREYLNILMRHGAVVNATKKPQEGYYRLIKDLGPALPEHDNAAKLRALRQKRREALAAVTAAQLALVKAQQALEDGDEAA